MAEQASGAMGAQTHINVGRKYKSRKERPCDACRRRKICCTRDAYEQDCSLCKTRGESCKYVLPPNVRRNRQPVAASNTRGSLGSSASTSTVTVHPAQCSGDGIMAQQNVTNATSEWICQFVGISGDQDPFVLRHCSFNHLNCYKAPDWAILRIKGEPSAIPLHFTVVPDSHLDARPDYYPPTDTEAIIHPHSEALLRTYFDAIHQSYPLLDPSRFDGQPQTNDPLRAVMYNLAAPFCQENRPFFPKLSEFVHQALPIERRHPRLETIEASLLHLQRHNTIHRAPTLPGLISELGALIGMAHDLGLNLDPTTWSLAPSDANRRIRIWWGIYIHDKWTALGLGRPSYLNDEHCNVPLPTVDNFTRTNLNGELMGMGPALQFVAMAALSTILADVLDTFYTLRAVERIKLLPGEMLLLLLDQFQARLQSWHAKHLARLVNTHALLDSSGTVILAYHTIQIVVLRAILRNLPIEHVGYANVRDLAKSELVDVMHFLENLNVNRLRAFWWSPMTRTNFALAGTFMFHQLLTSITTVDIEFWSATIAHYRSLLRLQSRAFDLTKLACIRLDLLAAGMGVDMPNAEVRSGEGERAGGGVRVLERRRVLLKPGSAEEWIARQGHEGMLLC